ncbi:MAG: MaoC family dehydratase [Nitrosospira sp.]|nr:MaoC family dehydratase [Nitrosospira sp.]
MDTPKSTRNYYFEDLSVGQHFETDTHTVSEDEIKAFAAAFDPQPFHLDEQLARDTLFGGLAASGWHTAAITMRLLVDLGIPTGGLIGMGGEIAWPRPTRPGDTLRVASEVLEVTPPRSHTDRGTVLIRNRIRNQHDEVVQEFTGRLIVRRRPMTE